MSILRLMVRMVFEQVFGGEAEDGPIGNGGNFVVAAFVVVDLFGLHVIHVPVTFHVDGAVFAEKREITDPIGLVGLEVKLPFGGQVVLL